MTKLLFLSLWWFLNKIRFLPTFCKTEGTAPKMFLAQGPSIEACILKMDDTTEAQRVEQLVHGHIAEKRRCHVEAKV